MDPWLNFVRCNTSLQLRAFFEVGGHPKAEPMVEVRLLISRSRIPQTGCNADDLGFLLPITSLLNNQLCGLQVERMFSQVGLPHRNDINFWTNLIGSYAFHATTTALSQGSNGLFILVDLNISFSKPVIHKGLLLSFKEVVGTKGAFGAMPASESSIEALQTKRYQGDGNDGSAYAVCLEDFEAKDQLTVIPCYHKFHQSCVTTWLQRSNICPLCRCALPIVIGEGVMA